jgi:endonuclease/exonuclease/phosphatase family metal-dependent hydrolase
MIIKLYSQNALDGFSKSETAEEYIEIIRRMKPDVAVFTEACKVGTEAVVTSSIKQLESVGYFVFHGPYNEQDSRKDTHGLLLAVHTSLVSAKKPRLTRIGERNILETWLKLKSGKDIHLLGVHLNDRNETKRQAELDDLLQLIDIDAPTILTGDMNTIHKQEAKGKTFRRTKRIHLLVRLKLHPKTDPTGQPMPNNRGRIGSVMYRLHEMASGKTIKRLEENGFTDTDPSHQPTFPVNSPSAQLDHTLVSHHFTVKSFKKLPEGSSDHHGIVVELEI